MTSQKAQREGMDRMRKFQERQARQKELERQREASRAKPPPASAAGGNGKKPVVPVNQAGDNGSKPVPEAAPTNRSESGSQASQCWWEKVTVVKPESAAGIKIGSAVYVDPKRVLIREQVRREYDMQTIRELADSIMEDGQEEPSHIVHRQGDLDHEWEVVNGHRRCLACLELEMPLYALVVKESQTDHDRRIRQLISNVHRENLPPNDIAIAADELERGGMTLEAIGRILHFGVPTVKKYLLLARELHPQVKQMMAVETPPEKRIGPDVAAEIARIQEAQQVAVAQEVAGMTISQARLHIRNITGRTDRDDGQREPKDDILSFRTRTPYDDRKNWKRFAAKVADWLAHHGELNQDFYQKLLAGCSEADFDVLLNQFTRAFNNLAVVIAKLEGAKPNFPPK